MKIRRDWGWAPDYVEAMWLMLQRERADDFVVATGQSNTLEKFVEIAFNCLGLDWREHVVSDPSLLRPTDIAENRGNPQKAKQLLGWESKHSLPDIVRLMVESDSSAFI
jgi:GDPmannose 4,6-dehydratase